MGWEFLLLGLLSEGVRGYYSGKGKSGGGKFIGGTMSPAEQEKFKADKAAAAGGDAEAKKRMEAAAAKANEEREQQKKEKVDTGYKTSDNSGVGKSKDSKAMTTNLQFKQVTKGRGNSQYELDHNGYRVRIFDVVHDSKRSWGWSIRSLDKLRDGVPDLLYFHDQEHHYLTSAKKNALKKLLQMVDHA